MAADFKSLDKLEQGALIAGVVSVLLSFFTAYVTFSIDGKGLPEGIKTSDGINAWHSFATFGVLLVVVATALVAVKAFSPSSLPGGAPWSLIILAVAALGTVLIVLRAFTADDGGFGGLGGLDVSVGPGWSGWLLMLSTIALTVFTALTFRSSGEKLPELKAGGSTPPPAPPAA